MTRPDFHTIRKMYVSSRIDTIPTNVLAATGMNYRKAAKGIAHAEFNEFIQEIREKAVEDYKASEKHREDKFDTWDSGFSSACKQWLKQRDDPSHPITRINPFSWRLLNADAPAQALNKVRTMYRDPTTVHGR